MRPVRERRAPEHYQGGAPPGGRRAVKPDAYATEFQRYVARHMSVEPSGVAGAGLGVFWRGPEALPAGRVVGRYAGVWHRSLDTVAAEGKYVLQTSEHGFVDAADPATGNWTRFVNDPRGPSDAPGRRRANLEFSGRGVDVVSVRSVRPGDELFVEYGREYWDAV